MSIRTEEYTMSVVQGEGKKLGDDFIEALTKEGLKINLDVTVLFKVDEAKASDIYSSVGLNYQEKIIRPIIRTSIRDVVARYEAKDIYSTKREEASKAIDESIRTEIEKRGFVLENILIRNVALPANLEQSIQEKLQAEQESEKYDFILKKETKEKERKRVEAEGQKEYQRIINKTLSENYLYINQLKDREGTIYVPTSPTSGLSLFKGVENPLF
jgi:regulator of protease activity HflC (stomatin/prohibitin superfamily)